MSQRPPTQEGVIEAHEHNTIIWDAQTWSYICTTCGLVLEGAPSQIHSQETFLSETNGRAPDERRSSWLARDVVEAGTIIGKQDLLKLPPQKRECFQRLYNAHKMVLKACRDDRRKSEFANFLHRLSKYKAVRDAFPSEHLKTSKLMETFTNCCRNYAARQGRQKLQTPTKIRIFLALIQPHIDSQIFQELVTRVAETKMAAVYRIRKNLGDLGNCATVNAQRKRDFIEKAKQLVSEAGIDPQTKKLAEDILTKRGRVNGLIARKRPAILAAAALYVAASHYTLDKQVSKKRIQRLVGASYIPQATIDDCRNILELDTERFERTKQQEFLLTCLKQRTELLSRRKRLRCQVAAQTKEAFPELDEILNLKNISTLKFLAQYPTTAEIAKLELDELIDFLKKAARGQLRDVNQLAARLLTEARKNETVGRRRPRPGNQAVIRELIKKLEIVETHRCELEREMLKAMGEDGRTLMQTPGIGLITATIMLVSRDTPTTHHLFIQQQSFLEQRLKDAIRIMQRNQALRHQYREWLDPNVPRMVAVQRVMEQLLQTLKPTTPKVGWR